MKYKETILIILIIINIVLGITLGRKIINIKYYQKMIKST